MGVSKTRVWGRGRGRVRGPYFLKECCFRVRVRVRIRVDTNPNTNLTLILTQTLKQHFFKKDKPRPRGLLTPQ